MAEPADESQSRTALWTELSEARARLHELEISENTVKNHVRNILEKLQLHSRMEAVMYAVRTKLLDIP